MMTSTLAGCTGGDPDGGGNDEIDMDILNQLIDDNLQDFINNTSVTVENHYHNNTTIVNNDNSHTNVSGSASIAGNGSTGALYLLDIEFSLSDLMELEEVDNRNNIFNFSWQYYDYATNEQRTDLFQFSCQVFYIVGANSTNASNQVSYWQDSSQYSNAWSNIYNDTVRNLLQSASNSDDSITGISIQTICDEDYLPSNYDHLLLMQIPLAEGMSIKGVYDTVGGYAQEEYVWSQNCNYLGRYDSDGDGYEEYNYEYSGEYEWKTSVYVNDCFSSVGSWTAADTDAAFYVDYNFETISWSYNYGSWIGGGSDSTLEVYVNNIRPDWNYRLIAYFTLSSTSLIE